MPHRDDDDVGIYHAITMEAVRGMTLGLAGHAWFEAYSVLTRLPPGARRSPADARVILEHDFPGSLFLDAGSAARLRDEFARLGIAGRAVYDGLVGAAARQHDVPLLSRDRRAARVYDSLGVDARIIS